MKKFFKIAVASFAIFCMGLLTSACSLFGGGDDQITESQWATAFAYDNKYVITLTETDGTNSEVATITVDGYKVKMSSAEYEMYLHYDGTNYWAYSSYENEWTKNEIDLETYEQMCYKFSSTDLSFNNFEYNSESKTFKAEDLSVMGMTFDSVTVKFDNLKLKEILFETEEGSFKFEYSFGNASVTLPTVEEGGEEPGQGGEEPGQGGEETGALTETEWNNAFTYNGDLTVNVASPQGYSIVTEKDGYKVKVTSSSMGFETRAIVDFDGAKYWYYTYDSSSSKWSKTEISEEEYGMMGNTSANSNPFKFSDFTYDSENELYYVENLVVEDETYEYVRISFENKKISAVSMSIDGVQVNVTYNYNDVTIILPEIVDDEEPGNPNPGEPGEVVDPCDAVVNGEQVDSSTWAEALSYNGKFAITMEIEEGVMVAQYFDENTIMQVTTYQGQSMTTYTHFDGEHYYLYTNFGQGWERQQLEDADYFSTKHVFEEFAVLNFNDFRYNEERNCYQAKNITVGGAEQITLDLLELTFVDGALHRMCQVSETDGHHSVVFDCSGNFTITLPEVDSGNEDEEEPGDGQALTTVTATEWAQAFSLQGKYQMSQNIMGMDVVSYVDGNTVMAQVSFQGVTSTAYSHFDGEKYWIYNYNTTEQQWYKREVTEEEYDESSSVAMGSYLNFADFTYNATTLEYEATNITVDGMDVEAISVKFQDKKVVSVDVTVDGNVVTTTFDYTGNFTITLPENAIEEQPGQDIVQGGEISEAEWYDALKFDDVVKYSMTMQSPEESTIYMYKDGTAYKMEGEAVGGEVYMHFDGITYWGYSYDEGTSSWQRGDIGEESFNQKTYEDMTQMFPYSSFVYSQESGAYIAQDLNGMNVTIIFNGKAVQQIIIELDGETGTITFDYTGDFTLTLPEVGSSEENNVSDPCDPVAGGQQVSAQTWADALSYAGKVKINEVIDGTGTVEVYVDGNIVKQIATVYEPSIQSNITIEMYLYNDGEKVWQYMNQGGSWTREELPAEFFQMSTFTGTMYNFDYAQFAYDSTRNCYSAKNVAYGPEGMEQINDLVELTFVDDVLYRVCMTFQGVHAVSVYDYSGDFTLTLPEISENQSGVEGTYRFTSITADFLGTGSPFTITSAEYKDLLLKDQTQLSQIEQIKIQIGSTFFEADMMMILDANGNLIESAIVSGSSEQAVGTYTIEGEIITMDCNGEVLVGTIIDGVITIENEGVTMIFQK